VTQEDKATPWVSKKKEARLLAIINAATEVFSEKGYEQTKLEDIAERMEMRGPSLYHYVKTKEDLFLRCADNMAEKVIENLKAAEEYDGSFRDKLKRLFYTQVLGQIRDFYPYYIPLFSRVTSREANIRNYLTEIRKQHFALFQKVTRQAFEAEEISNANWEFDLRLAMSTFGALHQWYRPDGDEGPEVVAEKVAQSLMKMVER